jgi:hypothetical protein
MRTTVSHGLRPFRDLGLLVGSWKSTGGCELPRANEGVLDRDAIELPDGLLVDGATHSRNRRQPGE